MKSMKLIAGTGLILAGLAAGALAQQATPAPSQPQAHESRHGKRWQMSDADRAAFLNSRIAGMKAGLNLNADQEKNWPAFETAMRAAAQERMAARETMMKRREEMRAGNTQPDVIAMMRSMSSMQTQRAQTVTKIADAAEPLYKSLDDAQKRRFGMMLRRAAGGGMDRGGHHRGRH